MKGDEFIIHLEIAGKQYPVKIRRGDERTEQRAREAAKRVQQMYLQRKRYVYEVFHELAKWFLLRKDVFYPFFLFSKASVAVDFLFRKGY